MEKKEIWKAVIGYKGLYAISSHGRIKSIRNGLMKVRLKDGYFTIKLSKNGIKKHRPIHQLVAESFLNHNKKKTGLIVDHIDNNPLNNHASNLQSITQRLNTSKDKKNKTSRFTGVIWHKNSQKWKAQIYIDGKLKHLGYSDSEGVCNMMYKKALNEIESKDRLYEQR